MRKTYLQNAGTQHSVPQPHVANRVQQNGRHLSKIPAHIIPTMDQRLSWTSYCNASVPYLASDGAPTKVVSQQRGTLQRSKPDLREESTTEASPEKMCLNTPLALLRRHTIRLPDIQILSITRGRHLDPQLLRSPVQSRPDIHLRIRQLRERNLQRLARLKLSQIAQQLLND